MASGYYNPGDEDTSGGHSAGLDYYKWYLFYLNGEVLPQTPSKITITNTSNLEVTTLANDESFVLPHLDGPLKFQFSFPVTARKYYWTNEDAETDFNAWYDRIIEWKTNRRPIEFFIVYPDGVDSFFSVNVYVDEYSLEIDAENHDDLVINLTLVEDCWQENQELSESVEHHLINSRNARGWRSGRGV